MATHSFQSHPPDFNLLVIFSSQNIKCGYELEHLLFPTGSSIWGTICKYQNGMPKVARNAFYIGEVWNQVCCHGNKIVKLIVQHI